MEQSSSENSGVDLEFESPFPLLNCVQRLEKRHEKPTFFAWRGQQRLWVNVWKVREGLYGFKMMYVDKNGYFPFSLCSVQGYLKSYEGDDTAVLAQKRYNYLMTALFSLLFGAGIGFGMAYQDDQIALTLGLIVGFVVSVVMFILMMAGSMWSTKRLVGVVKDSLGGLNPLPMSEYDRL